MNADDPRHGSPAGFYAHRTDGSSVCPPCDLAIFRYRKKWRAIRETGRRYTVPIEPVAEHIKALEAAGMSTVSILAASGVTRSAFYCIRSMQRPRCRATIADRILSIEPSHVTIDSLASGQMISNVGTRRRIRALLAIGWTHREMFNRSGIFTSVKLSQDGETVTVDAHRRIATLYDELSMTLGPSQRTRDRAIKLGYAPPLAWDDDRIDDPTAEPVGLHQPAYLQRAQFDEAKIERRMAGDRTAKTRGAESVEVVRRLLNAGHSQHWIGQHTGLKTERYMPIIRAAQATAPAELEPVAA